MTFPIFTIDEIFKRAYNLGKFYYSFIFMKTLYLMILAILGYIAGITVTILAIVLECLDPNFLPSVSPIPFTLVIIFGFLVNCIASARLVTPLFQFYTQKLYWLKEWNKISDSTFFPKLAQAKLLKQIFEATTFLSCWLLVPLLFYGICYVALNIYICNVMPDYCYFSHKLKD